MAPSNCLDLSSRSPRSSLSWPRSRTWWSARQRTCFAWDAQALARRHRVLSDSSHLMPSTSSMSRQTFSRLLIHRSDWKISWFRPSLWTVTPILSFSSCRPHRFLSMRSSAFTSIWSCTYATSWNDVRVGYKPSKQMTKRQQSRAMRYVRDNHNLKKQSRAQSPLNKSSCKSLLKTSWLSLNVMSLSSSNRRSWQDSISSNPPIIRFSSPSNVLFWCLTRLQDSPSSLETLKASRSDWAATWSGRMSRVECLWSTSTTKSSRTLRVWCRNLAKKSSISGQSWRYKTKWPTKRLRVKLMPRRNNPEVRRITTMEGLKKLRTRIKCRSLDRTWALRSTLISFL